MSERKWLLRTRAVIIFCLGTVIAVAAGVLFPYFLAGWISSIPILVANAVIAVTAVGWISAWVAARIWQSPRRARFAAIAALALAALFTTVLYVSVLRSTPEIPVASFGANTNYWRLPTGSRIAYYEYDPPSNVSVRSESILFLHGGPGLAITPFEHSFFQQFAAEGYRVYLYDQAGSGLSAFLPLRQYTISRFVEDIEAIRKQIGAEKLILIGHSWGSTLAASYIARYPEHVAKVVFYSPGPIWNLENYNFDLSRSAQAQAPFKPSMSLRLWAALFLAENRDNPVAGERLLPQREAETLFLSWFAPQAYGTVCSGDTRALPPYMLSLQSSGFNPGFNPYVLDRLTDILVIAQLDPHSRLRGNRTPAIVLFSECDIIPWASPLDYRRTFENARVYYIARAGHIIELAQPELMFRVIRAFLLDQPDVIPAYLGDADPRTVQGSSNHAQMK